MTPPRPEFLTGSRLRPGIPHGVGGFGSKMKPFARTADETGAFMNLPRSSNSGVRMTFFLVMPCSSGPIASDEMPQRGGRAWRTRVTSTPGVGLARPPAGHRATN